MLTENEQPDSKVSFFYLDICCDQVERKFGIKKMPDWVNSNYQQLSFVLLQETNVSISPNTLKRIFGKLKTSSRYYPQKATRDALAVYTGYKNWDDFVQSHKTQLPENVETTEQKTISSTQPGKKWRVFILLLLAIIVMIWWLSALFSKKAGTGDDYKLLTGKVHLVCTNPEGPTPHSSIFKLQLPVNFTLTNPVFSIDFGDTKRSVTIIPGQIVSHYFEIPGRYYVTLNYANHPIDTVAVYLKTNSWTATARMDRDTVRVWPIREEGISQGKILSVNPQELHKAGIDTVRTFYVDFVNATPTNIDGDDFELIAHIKASDSRAGVRCSQVNTTVFGEKTKHAFFVMKPGCEAWIEAQFSDFRHIGTESDLGKLAADLSHGGTIRLHISHKKVTIFINDQKAFQTSYQIPVGNIYGIVLSFSGIGAIYNVTLKDLRNGKTESLL